jgi:cytochrome P450
VLREARRPTEGLTNALVTAEVDGDRLSEEEIVANVIVTMVGGQETTTNLIGHGLLTLLRRPEQLAQLRARAPPAVQPTSQDPGTSGGACGSRDPFPSGIRAGS